MELALARRDLPPMGTGAMLYFGFVSLVLGVVIVWLYAAILPQMGRGIKTALTASVVVWFLAYFLANVAMVAYGFMPAQTLCNWHHLGFGGVTGGWCDRNPFIQGTSA